jgi:Mg2+ and Co2+ transporter CorA
MADIISQAGQSTLLTAVRTIVDVPGLLWLDLEDPNSPALDELASRYGFHELSVEDCRHQIQLAKVDHYEGYSFVVVHTTKFIEDPGYFGMNFKFIPFSEDVNGIWYTTAGLVTIVVVMLAWFRHKKWI